MRNTERIPSAVCHVVGDVIGNAYGHNFLDTLFKEHGAPGEAPDGARVTKVTAWLKRTSVDVEPDALGVLGGVIAGYMDDSYSDDFRVKGRQRISEILAKYGMTYGTGRVHAAGSSAPAMSLDKAPRSRDLGALEREHQRAVSNVASDSPAAITAASSLLESLFKVYLVV